MGTERITFFPFENQVQDVFSIYGIQYIGKYTYSLDRDYTYFILVPKRKNFQNVKLKE